MKSAKLKYEGLGRITISMAGQPTNCFYKLMKDNFGYTPASLGNNKVLDKGESQASESEDGVAPTGDRPLNKRTLATASGSKSGKEANPPPPECNRKIAIVQPVVPLTVDLINSIKAQFKLSCTTGNMSRK